MRHFLIVLVIYLVPSTSIALDQVSDTATVMKVNSTLWAPFKKAYSQKDIEAFMALHTEDVMRIGPEMIKIGKEYRESVERGFLRNPERRQTIDFAMEHRVYNGDQGYEVGFYRIIYTIDEEVVHTSYARFHVRLRKEDGQWKIAQDWDIDKILDEEISEKHFLKAEFLDLEY